MTTPGNQGVGRFKVVVTRELPGPALDHLRAQADVVVWPGHLPPTAAALAELAQDADALLTLLTDRVDATLLDRCRSLRVVANYAVGVDNIDLDELTRRGIPVSNTPDVLTNATADLAFGLLLCIARRIVEARQFVLDGHWDTWDPSGLLGLELAGSTFGIVGMGRIGQAVATRASAFGMTVIATSSHEIADADIEQVDLDALLQRADVVSLHCALTSATRHLINEHALGCMKNTAYLINTSRGAVIDARALADALYSGKIAGAALDVTDPEPIASNNALLGLTNCLIVPHIGSATSQTRETMATIAVGNVLAGLSGRQLPNCVNPAVYNAT